MTEEFKHGEEALPCFNCGTCTAGCAVREVHPGFDPRKIIRQVLLGRIDDGLLRETAWLCADCHTCSERCPQGVPVNEIIMALRHMAVKQGIVPAAYRGQMDTIHKSGHIYEVADFNKKRAKTGLPELRDDGAPYEKIYSSLGLDKVLKQEKEK